MAKIALLEILMGRVHCIRFRSPPPIRKTILGSVEWGVANPASASPHAKDTNFNSFRPEKWQWLCAFLRTVVHIYEYSYTESG